MITSPETFTDDERKTLQPFFTNLDSHVFALTNLPETVKGALFARYSRSAKSLRRLFLDEFAGQPGRDPGRRLVGRRRAGRKAVRQGLQRLRRRLGRAARRRARRVRVRVERPDQDPRVGPPHGLPRAVDALRALHRQAPRPLALSRAGGSRGLAPRPLRRRRWMRRSRPMRRSSTACRSTSPRGIRASPQDSEGVHRAAIRAKALDTLRGMLPAATQSNVGIYGTGQAYESLLLRMRAHPLDEVRQCGDQMLVELRKLVPAFLTRVDQPERGGRWSEYLASTRERDESRRRDAPRGRRGGAARGSHAHGLRSGRRDQDRRGGALRRDRSARRSAAGARAPHDGRRSACRCCTPTSASAATAATVPAARSSARRIGSTS